MFYMAIYIHPWVGMALKKIIPTTQSCSSQNHVCDNLTAVNLSVSSQLNRTQITQLVLNLGLKLLQLVASQWSYKYGIQLVRRGSDQSQEVIIEVQLVHYWFMIFQGIVWVRVLLYSDKCYICLVLDAQTLPTHTEFLDATFLRSTLLSYTGSVFGWSVAQKVLKSSRG